MTEPRYVLARNPGAMTLDGTRTYVVGRDRPVVIDPGPSLSEHVRAVVALLGGAAPVAILLTHSHRDHSGSAVELAALTGAPLRMAPGALDPGELSGRYELLAEDEIIETDEGVLRCLATPGHAPEHTAFMWTRSDGTSAGAFVGDLILGVGDTTLIATPEGDVGAYLHSLDRVEALDLPVLYPTHGPLVTRPAEALQRFREHRLERVRQIQLVRAAHPAADADEIVTRAYGRELPEELRHLAMASVDAILRYLSRSVSHSAG